MSNGWGLSCSPHMYGIKTPAARGAKEVPSVHGAQEVSLGLLSCPFYLSSLQEGGLAGSGETRPVPV